MRQLGVGVPVCVPPSVETIVSLGYVDDTVGFSSIDDRQRVADHLRVIIDCVGQHNNSSKMHIQVLQVKQGSVCSVSKSIVWDDEEVWSTCRHQHIKFLGGNSNILGGFPTIKKVILKWSRTVISTLRGWPVSVGVAHIVVEGLVVNRLVFCCCVNVPTDVQISSVTGSICRVYRLVFGLAPNTPRACIVSILGRAPPDQVLWATIINELFKSLNGPNALLAQTVWAHWSNPCLHRFDSDSQRIRSRLQSLDIHFRKLVLGQGTKWCVSPPRGGAFPAILYVFGDASLKDCWGGAAKVVDSQGHVWLDTSVSLSAIGLNTKLVEASVVVSAVVAIAEYVSTHGMCIEEIWVWSHCLSAVQSLQSRDMADKTTSIMDRVVSHFVLTHLPVQMGWVPAQHDTELDDWISSFNSEMDSEAKAGARGERQEVSVLDVWLDRDSILPFQGDRLMVDLKRHLLSRTDDALLSVSPSRSPIPPERSWRMVLQESVSGLKCRMQLQPLGIEHWGRIRAWSVYASADQWEWQHRDTECSLCSMWCHSVTQHRFHECMLTKVRVLAWSGQLCEILYAARIPRNRILLRWGGC